MTPENPKREKKIISYRPKEVIEFFETRGPFTARDLEKRFGLDGVSSQSIIIDLYRQSILDKNFSDWEVDEEESLLRRKHSVLGKAVEGKESFGQERGWISITAPYFSKLTLEVTSDILTAGRNLGMSIEELKKRIKSGDLDVVKRLDLVLSEASPEEIRGFGEDV
jgi:hypothetical protein